MSSESWYPLADQVLSQLGHRLRCPAQQRHRIPAGLGVHQFVERLEQPRLGCRPVSSVPSRQPAPDLTQPPQTSFPSCPRSQSNGSRPRPRSPAPGHPGPASPPRPPTTPAANAHPKAESSPRKIVRDPPGSPQRPNHTTRVSLCGGPLASVAPTGGWNCRTSPSVIRDPLRPTFRGAQATPAQVSHGILTHAQRSVRQLSSDRRTPGG